MSNDPRDSLLTTSPEELALRKYSGALSVLGNAIVIFGIWDMVKTVLLTVYMSDELRDEIFNSAPPEYLPIAIGFVVVLAISTYMLRIYIGLSARAEAAGKKKKATYLILTVVLFAQYILFFWADLVSAMTPNEQFFALIGDMFIGVTSMGFVVFLVVNAIRVRRLKKQLGEA